MLEQNGDFDSEDAVKGWNSQNCLIGKIQEYAELKESIFLRAPSSSWLKDNVPSIVKRWRDQRAAIALDSGANN